MFLSGQKCEKKLVIKKLKEMTILSFDDYYDIATTLDHLMDTCNFTMDQWMELYDISERIVAFEKECDEKGMKL